VKDSGSVDTHYYNWVDEYNTLGFGNNTPVVTGNGSDSMLVLVNGKWVIMRVPYPMGFFAKGLDGRIDDPKGGWKGRGLWTTWGTRTPFHSETGKGTTSKVVKFQVGPIRWLISAPFSRWHCSKRQGATGGGNLLLWDRDASEL